MKIYKEFLFQYKKFRDNYEIIKYIASGCFGQEYLIKNKFNQKQYVLKNILLENEEEQKQQQYKDLMLEIEIQSKAIHPNILKLKEYFLCSDIFDDEVENLAIILEYANGGTLDQYLQNKNGRLEESEILDIFEQILLAIQYLHKQNVVHMDITMLNILFKDGTVKICDMGLSRSWYKTVQNIRAIAGTPDYYCPEQIKAISKYQNKQEPHLKLDKSIDAWQLGIILYKMCTNSAPFPPFGLSLEEIEQNMKKNKEIQIPKRYSQFLLDLIKRFLQFDPQNRIKLKNALKYLNSLKDIFQQEQYNYLDKCQQLSYQGTKTLEQLYLYMESNQDQSNLKRQNYNLQNALNNDSQSTQTEIQYINPNNISQEQQNYTSYLQNDIREKQNKIEDLQMKIEIYLKQRNCLFIPIIILLLILIIPTSFAIIYQKQLNQTENDNESTQNSSDSEKNVYGSQYFQDSTLIMNEQQDLWLYNQLYQVNEYNSISLIYRGTRDGFSYEEFHEIYDQIEHVIFMIKSEYGKTFGGFKTVSLNTYEIFTDTYYSDKDAFLFQLDEQSRHDVYQNEDSAIRTYEDTLIMFGAGTDLVIANNCNQNDESYSNFGLTYQPPDGMEYETPEAQSYLAGSKWFRVEELEVFLLQE